ncbi:MAG: hypothetical protein RLN99_14980, partial [Kiloniellaceae bacterium]
MTAYVNGQPNGSWRQQETIRTEREAAGRPHSASLGSASLGSASLGAGLPVGEGVYAALDLGTNNCRLLVARPARDGFQVVDAFSRIVRLGEGL